MTQPQAPDAASVVRRIVAARTPLTWRNRELSDDVPLGANGFGLDSIAMVELLLDCEAALGIPFPPALFDDGPLTIGRVIGHAMSGASRAAR